MRSRWLPSSSPPPNSSDRNELRLKYMRGFSTLLSGSERPKQGLGGQTPRAGATTGGTRDPSRPRPHRHFMSRTTPTTQRQILSMSEWDRSMRDLGASSQDRRGGAAKVALRRWPGSSARRGVRRHLQFQLKLDSLKGARTKPAKRGSLRDHRAKRDETDGPAENRAKPANAVRNEGRTSEMEAPHCPHGSPPTSIAREAAA